MTPKYKHKKAMTGARFPGMSKEDRIRAFSTAKPSMCEACESKAFADFSAAIAKWTATPGTSFPSEAARLRSKPQFASTPIFPSRKKLRAHAVQVHGAKTIKKAAQ